ncbi:hypothetical protein V6N12_058936 [Hibiscus sabdariffa]|uniref:Reverse transcriptase domain-containing protein n=1 Tax=Hibiscus sabdariffa TaxID=183260 RepID=A0ABR2ETM9_9ROSI
MEETKSNVFPIKRGLRQGCPLSPLLFNIIEEALNVLFYKDVEKGLISGVAVRPVEHGSLGICDMKVKNHALLNKWLWRYGNEPDNLWRIVIDEKYELYGNDLIPKGKVANFGSKVQRVWVWKIKFRRNLFSWETKLFSNFISALDRATKSSVSSDCIKWCGDTSVRYSPKA